MTPDENFAFINSYLERMGPVIRDHNGFIDKYIGDAIMALFEQADDALRASLAMLDTLASFNVERRRAPASPPIAIGIGLNTGSLCWARSASSTAWTAPSFPTPSTSPRGSRA